ncbi:Calx-beta domain-containing protein [uncultured Gimesia sp.]|uniref:Calx-beta domain-containing protein n=1 Tax=uncultured Gimesia sp. TaxID=1678688 RepID=UPI0030D9D4AC
MDAAQINIHGIGGNGTASDDGFVATGESVISSVVTDISIISDGNVWFYGDTRVESSTGDLDFTVNYLGGNNIGVIRMNTGTVFNAGSGNINIDAYSDITLTSLITAGIVAVDSTIGSILDNGDVRSEIFATTAILNAYGSVGTSVNPLETNVVNLSGTGTSGGFHVNNSVYKRIIDDGDTGFTTTGWAYDNAPGSDYNQSDIHYLEPGAHPGESASWEFSNLLAGTYRISGFWAPWTNRATNTELTVSGIEGGAVSQTINQQYLSADLSDAGKDWQDLGYFTVDESGTITVTMANENADGYVLADAMRIEKAAEVSISDVTLDESAGTATFSVISNQAVGSAFSVDFATADGTAVAGSDYTATSGTLNFAGTAAGETQTITVYLTDDAAVESDEALLVNLSNLITGGQAITLKQTQASATVTDNDSTSLSIADITVNEGAGTATFTVTLNQAVQNGISVDWATADGTANAVADYSAGSGTLNFAGAVGETQTITVTLTNDSTVELDENFQVNLSNLQAGGLNVTLADDQAAGTISNDDAAVLSIGDVTQAEGDLGTTQFTFTVSIDNPSDADITFDYTTVSDTADATDFTPVSGTATIAAGQTSTTITVDVLGDGLVEADEQFFVELSNLQSDGREVQLNLALANLSLLGSFNTSSSAQDVHIVGNLAYVADNNAGLHVLDISNPANIIKLGSFDTGSLARTVQVIGNVAYVADFNSGLRVLDVSNPGNITELGFFDTTGSARDVQVIGNIAYVADHSAGLLLLDISDPANITELATFNTLGYSFGIEVIGNIAYVADGQEGLRVLDISNPASITELGSFDTSYAQFVKIVGDIAYVVDGSAGFRILDISDPADISELGFFDTPGSALSLDVAGSIAYIGDGYDGLKVLDVSDSSNIFEIAAYDTPHSANGLQAIGDVIYLADGTSGLLVFELENRSGTGTITNDDSASLLINNVTIAENAGTVTFTVTLDEAVQGGVAVDWATADGTAAAGSDYIAGSGTLNFTGNAGETQTITVTISDDAMFEADESFFINLSNLQAGGLDVTLTDAQATGTISNDESATLSIDNVTVNESLGTATFTVTLDEAVQGGAAVDWSTLDGTALAGTDYTAGSGTLNFTGTAGETQTITVTLTDDNDIELTETLLVTLSNLVATGGVILSQSQGAALITNDDSLVIDEDAPEQTVNLTGIVASVSGLQVTGVTASSNNVSLIPNPAVNYIPGDSTGTLTLTPNPDQHGSALITITVTDELSVETTHTFTVVVNPVNDVPTVSAVVSSTVTEDDGSYSLDLLTGASDIDLSDILSVSGLTLVGGDDSGIIQNGNSLDITPSAYNSLAVGETEVITYSYNVTDGNGGVVAQTATITITGVNDIPTVSAAVSTTVTEDDGSFSLDLITGASDGDTSDILSVNGLMLLSGDASGITDNGNSLSIDPSVYNSLAVGESEVITYSYNVTDSNGGIVAQTATITITGMNDVPTVGAAVSSSVTEDDSSYSLDLLAGASDVDLSDILSVSGLTLVSGDASGIIQNGNSLDITLSAYKSLAVGEIEVITYSYNVTDSNGGVMAQIATITITGVNDAPTVSAAVSSTVTEDDGSYSLDLLTGTSDVDLSDILNVTDLTFISGDASGITDNGNSLSIDPSIYSSLAAGESEVITYTYNVDDGNGGIVAQTATITITGVNDLPALDAIPDPVAIDEDALEQTINLTGIFAGGGETQTLTVSATSDNLDLISNPSVTYTSDNSTGTLTYTPAADQNGSAIITVKVTDDQGGETVRTFTVNVNAVQDAPVAQDDVLSTDESNSISGTLFADHGNGPDSDPDTTDTLSIIEVAGVVGNVGSQITLASGALLTVNSDGTFNYDPNGQLDWLAAGETHTDTFTYKLDDSSGGTDTATVNVTVTGSNATLFINDVSVDELVGTATFTVTLDKPVVAPVAIDFSTSDGTAIAGNDYDALSGTLNFDGTTAESKSITITINDDTLVEMPQNFYVNFANLQTVGGFVDVIDAEGLGTISSTDSAILSIGNDLTVLENGVFEFELTLDQASEEEVTVLVNTVFGTADSNDLTAIVDQLVTFAAGQTTATVTVSVDSDNIVEVDETFTVVLSDPQINGTTALSLVDIGDSTAVGTIQNDDSATITIDDVTVSESGTATFTVTLDKAVDIGFTLDYATSDDTATASDAGVVGDDDYESTSGTLSFDGTAGETKTITVMINGDNVVEFDDAFFVDLSNLLVGDRSVSISDSQAIGTITNDDRALIGYGASGSGSQEGDSGVRQLQFAAAIQGPIAADLYLTVSTADGTATAADGDYLPIVEQIITIPAGDYSYFQIIELDAAVTVYGDTKIEPDEIFYINMSLDTGGLNVIPGSDQMSQEVTIGTDDYAFLTVDDVSVDEEAGMATFTVTLDGKDVGSAVQVDYATVSASTYGVPEGFQEADASDFTSVSGTLTFSGVSGETQTIVVPISTDSIVEFDEVFYLELSNELSSVEPVFIRDDLGIATIVNNDSALISISDVSVNESTGEAVFTISVDKEIQGSVSFDYSTADGTATVLDGDYSSVSGTVTITGNEILINGVSSTTITVPITDESVLEVDEEFLLNLSNLSSDSIVLANMDSIYFEQAEIKATILNDDTASISIDDVTIDENLGAAIFTVSLTNGGGNIPFSVDYSTADSTATLVNNDYGTYDGSTGEYNAVTGTINFNGNANESQTIIIPITSDDFMEADEIFFVNLSNIQSENHPVVLLDSQGEGTILNDDHKMIIDDGDSGFSTTGTWNSQSNTGDFGDDSLADPVGDETASAFWTFSNLAPGSYRLSRYWKPDTSLSWTLIYEVNGVASSPIFVSQKTLTSDLQDEGVGWEDLGDGIFEPDANGVIEVKLYGVGSSGPVIADAMRLERVPSVSVDDIEISEDEGVARFTVSLDVPIAGGFTVDYYTEDGTALLTGSDYSGRSGSLTFVGIAGESHVITIPITNDSSVENTETFQLHLENLQGTDSPIIISKAVGTATVLNDDYASLSISDASLNESLGSIVFTVTLNNEVDAQIQVNYATADDTATIADSDYTDTGAFLTFDGYAGETQQIIIPVTDDTVLERDETFFVNLSNLVLIGFSNLDAVSNPLVTISDDQGMGTIKNDDAASLTIDDVIINEKSPDGINPATATFTVTLSNDVDAPFSIDYSTENSTASSFANDFIATSGTLNFTGDANETQTITVTITEDQLLEPAEIFFVRLSNLIAAGREITIADGLGTATITDVDAAYSISDVTVVEAQTGQSKFVTFEIQRAGSKAGDLSEAGSIDYRTLSTGTASDLDYNEISTPVTVSFSADATALVQYEYITIQIYGDDIVELDETFIVELENPTDGYISKSQGIGTIINDDHASLSINNVSVNESEGNAVFTVTLDKEVDTGFSVAYESKDGTASSLFGDYTQTAGTINFDGNAGEAQTITVEIADDSVLDYYENFYINLTDLLGVEDRSVRIVDSQGLGSIVDNESSSAARITMGQPPALFENAGTVELTLQLSQAVDGDVSVAYETIDGTATSAGGDYIAQSGVINFTDGVGTITISLTDDEIVELTESFYVRLSDSINTGQDPVVIRDDYTEITILNEDKIEVSINDVTVQEDAQFAEFTISLNQPVTEEVTVLASGASGSAVFADFQILNDKLITFEAGGATTQTLIVPIYNDPFIEETETYFINLDDVKYGGVSDNNTIIISDSQGIGTINDNDSGSIAIDDVIVDEDAGQAVFTVTLSEVSNEDVTVTANIVDIDFAGTQAENGVDFSGVTTNQLVTILAGERTAEIVVDIVNDNFFEGTEFFTIKLSNPLVGGTSQPGSISINPEADTGRGTIKDNDSLSYSINDVIVNENDASATFAVTLDHAAQFTIVIPFLIEGNTATANEDFESTPSFQSAPSEISLLYPNNNYLLFTPGELLTKTITVPIIQDDIIETPETFYVTLGEVIVPIWEVITPITPVIPASPVRGVGTIIENTGLSLSIGDVSDMEHGDFTFDITLNQALTEDLTLNVTTIAGSASDSGPDADFTPLVDHVVTIAAGQTVGTVTVYVVDDGEEENSESFSVEISDPQYLNSTESLDVTIVDNIAVGTIKNNDLGDPPAETNAVDDYYYLTVTNLEESVELDVLLNDTNAPNAITAVESASGGVTEIAAGGSNRDVIVFTPSPGFSGSTTFEYESSNGRATVTIIVIDPLSSVGDFRSDRFDATIDIPELGAVLPDFETQLGAIDEYLNNPSVGNDPSIVGQVITLDDGSMDVPPQTYEDATGGGGSYKVSIDFNSYRDQSRSGSVYTDTLLTSYTYTEIYSGSSVEGHRNAFKLVHGEIRNYSYTHTAGAGAAYVETLVETIEDNYKFGAEFAEEEMSEDGFSSTLTTRIVNGGVVVSGINVNLPSESNTHFGKQSIESKKESTYADIGGSAVLAQEIYEFDMDFYENTHEVTHIYETQLDQAEQPLVGTLQTIVSFGGNSSGSPGDRDSWLQHSKVTVDYTGYTEGDPRSDYIVDEDFAYSGSGESTYSHTEFTSPPISGVVKQTITQTPTEDLYDLSGNRITEYTWDITTESFIAVNSTDNSVDRYSFSYDGKMLADNTFDSNFSYSDNGFSSGQGSSHTVIKTTSEDLDGTNSLGTNYFEVDETTTESYGSQYKTIATASRYGNVTGTAESEYTSSGSSGYDVNSQTTINTIDTSVRNIESTFDSVDILNNYGGDAYSTSELINETLSNGLLEGSSTYNSNSHGTDYDFNNSTVETSTTDNVDPLIDIISTSLVESSDQGTTGWGSNSKTVSSHKRYDFASPITEAGDIYKSTSTDTYEDGSSGNRTTTLHTRDTLSYNDSTPNISSLITTSDDFRETRNYDWSSSESGTAVYTTLEESLDETGDSRQETFSVEQTDDYEYLETDGIRDFSIYQASTQSVHGTKDKIETHLNASDSYEENGSAYWSVENGGTSTYESVDVTTSADAGENWTEPLEGESTSSNTSQDTTYFVENGSSTFTQTSNSDLLEIDNSEDNVQRTIIAVTSYFEKSGPVSPSGGVNLYVNTTFSTSVFTDDYVDANGFTENHLITNALEKKGSNYRLTEHNDFEILDTSDPLTVYEERGIYDNKRLNLDENEKTSYERDYQNLVTYGTLNSDGESGAGLPANSTSSAEHAPQFQGVGAEGYARSLSETAPGLPEIFTVSATDLQGDPFKYRLIGGEAIFEIDENSGVITLKKEVDPETGEVLYQRELDYETRDFYTFAVQAYDEDGNVSTTSFELTVLDDPEEAPEFLENGDEIEWSLAENTALGVIGSLPATDSDGDAITYAIETGGDLFSVDANGTISLTQLLDFETSTSTSFVVSASDGTNTTSMTVQVDITDIDDTPVFDDENTIWDIDEDTPAGTVLGTLSVYDPQGDALSFQLTSGSEYFSIDPATGAITLDTALDFETITETTIAVKATDPLGNSAETTINVVVNDVDENPHFSQNENVLTLSEETAVGTLVRTITATDFQGNLITDFTLIHTDSEGVETPETRYAIDASGNITLLTALDYEVSTVESFEVVATDSLGRSTRTSVVIFVEDVFDSPIFYNEEHNYTWSVAADTLFGAQIGDVDAFDADGLEVTFSLLPVENHNLFSINATSGVITLNTSLEGLTNSIFNIEVQATDGQGNTGTTGIKILVTESMAASSSSFFAFVSFSLPLINYPPVFTTSDRMTPTSGYVWYVADDLNEGLLNAFESVYAYDPENAGSLSFSLTETNGNTNDFLIDATSGAVYLKLGHSLDAGVQSFYEFTVTVQDIDGKISTTYMSITVGPGQTTDTDPPVFNQSSYSWTVDESVGTGPFGSVSATDASGPITYARFSGDNKFVVSSSTGEISRAPWASLDYETQTQHNFTVKATDAEGNYSTVPVTIYISYIPVNDDPYFNSSSYSWTGAENTAVGTVLIDEISAYDPEQQTLEYSFSSGTPSAITDQFSINSANGEITLLTGLNYEAQSRITFFISVEDPAGLTDSAHVTINVTDVEEDPVFSPIVVDVNENLPAGTEIADARHQDFLSDPDGLVASYNEYTGNTNPKFSISSDGNITLNNPLDYESYGAYPHREFFYIEARDAQGAVLNLITVQVNVVDVNERPEITSTVTDITVAEGSFDENFVIEIITATDPDAGQTSQLTFSFIGYLNSTYFTIDNSGKIRQKAELNYENPALTSLLVRAVDPGELQSMYYTINVIVTDLNEPPIFEDLSVSKSEHTLVNDPAEPIVLGAVLGATDPEGDTITYAFVDETITQFAINASTGDITLLEPLDYETTTSHQLEIRVSDLSGSMESTVGTLTIHVSNVLEGPSLTGLHEDVSELESTGTILGKLNGYSPEGYDLTYALAPEETITGFSIHPTTGAVTLIEPLDYETEPFITFAVRVTDSEGDTADATVTIDVQNAYALFATPRIGTYGTIQTTANYTDESYFDIKDTSEKISVTHFIPYINTFQIDDLLAAVKGDLEANAGALTTAGGLAPLPIFGDLGLYLDSFTVGSAATGDAASGRTFNHNGGNFRLSKFHSESEEKGEEFLASTSTDTVVFYGDAGFDVISHKAASHGKDVQEGDSWFETLDASQSVPVIDEGLDDSQSQTVSPGPSLSASSTYYEDQGKSATSVSITTYVVEKANGDLYLHSVEENAENSDKTWDMVVRAEQGGGNNGFNSKNESSGASTYNGYTSEAITSKTDPDSPGKLHTKTVLTEDFVSHTEEEMKNEVRIGGANNASSDFRVNAEILIRGNSTVDSEVNAVKTTDFDGVVSETGRRETMRSARDRQDSTVSVEGSMGGGGYGMDGTFEMTVASVDETVTTQHFITVNGTLTRRDYTEYQLIANNVFMSMSAGGDGFEFSFSQSAGNQFTQHKTGTLENERVNGIKRGHTNNSFSITVDVNPNYVYHVTSRARSTYFNEFDYTRYFDENGNVIIGNAGLKLHSYNSENNGLVTAFDSRTGDTETHTSDSHTERTGDNTTEGSSNGLNTTTHADGTVEVTLDDHDFPPTDVPNATGGWDGPQATPFNIPNPAAAGLMPGNFFGQGIFPFGTSLFGTGYGSSSGRAPRTDLPPISSGTDPDGTYWERFDNGTIWIYREYDTEGGKLIREEWGRHIISLPDILGEYKAFLDEQTRERHKFTDMIFTDPRGLMDALNDRANSPSQQEKLNSLRKRIKLIKELLITGTLRDDVHLHYKDRLNELVEEYVRLGGSLILLKINKPGEGGIASDIEKHLALRDKAIEVLLTLKSHARDKANIREEMRKIFEGLPEEAFIVTRAYSVLQGSGYESKRLNREHPEVQEYLKLERELNKILDSEATNYKTLREELLRAWIDTLTVSERYRYQYGDLNPPEEFDLPLSEDELQRLQKVEILVIILLEVGTDGLAAPVITAILSRTVSGARILATRLAKLKSLYGPDSKLGNLIREYEIVLDASSTPLGGLPLPIDIIKVRKIRSQLTTAQNAQVDELLNRGYPFDAVIRHVKGGAVLPFDILPYKVGRFSTNLPGHEVLNNRFLELRGLAKGRGVGPASTQNPAIALPRELHASTIQKLQRKHGVWFAKDLAKLSRTQIINKNLIVLREAGVSEKIVQQIRRAVLIHARKIGRGR